MTYEYFKKQNDQSKKFGAQVGRITQYNPMQNRDLVQLEVNGSYSVIQIPELIQNIVYDGLGCLSNPSALANWHGWDKMLVVQGENAVKKLLHTSIGIPVQIDMSGEYEQTIFMGIKNIQSSESFAFFDGSGFAGMFGFSADFIRRNPNIKFKFGDNNEVKTAQLLHMIRSKGA